MALNLSMPKVPYEVTPRITVIGVGGAGGNAVNNMIRSNLEGVEFIVCNTDSQALAGSICPRKIQLGVNITQGLGAGSRPDVGRAAAEEAIDELIEQIHGSNMVFITAGMGGGTGTGGAPVIARAAREHGVLTVGVVTKPFHFEGTHRMRLAESGISELQQFVDTLLIIPNQNLFRVANEKTTFADAFAMADEVLHSGVRGVTDLMVMPGLINLDFADIRTVMTEMGKAMMGTGEASGENRAVAAAEAAISNPLLDDVSMKGARGVLINITGGYDMTLFEVDEAANRIRDEVDPEANIIFGSTFDQHLEGRMRISVVATGIDAAAMQQSRPVSLSLVAKGGRVMTTATESAAEPVAPRPQPMRSAEPPPRRETAAAPPQMARPQPQYQAQTWTAEPASGTPGARIAASYANGEQRLELALDAEPEETETAEPAESAPSPTRAAPEPQRAAEAARQQPRQRGLTPPAGHAPRGGERGSPERRDPAAAPERPAPEERKPEPRRRGGNLFSRVTGGAANWARQTSADLREATPAAVLERKGQEPAPRPAAVNPQTGQPRLSGLDAKDRLTSSRADEDMLDIPAFLRRQAN